MFNHEVHGGTRSKMQLIYIYLIIKVLNTLCVSVKILCALCGKEIYV